LKNSTNLEKKKKLSKKDCLSANKIHITEKTVSLEDEMVKSSQFLDINFTEYAPEVFKYLRRLEGLKDDHLIK
jgi:hypothetical protein